MDVENPVLLMMDTRRMRTSGADDCKTGAAVHRGYKIKGVDDNGKD
ncbi:hypothetical protein CBFG_02349 [Clostridiales bacterium 1_7_47FAA]|nr:hypothetical protein CBFG_02349 [Clostridiales bacterium 1_7_47FAA]